MTFIESIKTCLEKTLTIKGRASRSEYWWFMLFFYIYLMIVFIGSSMNQDILLRNDILSSVYGFICGAITICLLIIFIALLTSRIRRLHDIGRSGWWMLIGFIPYLGSLVLLLWLIKGSDGDNEYGPDPTGESFNYEEYHPEP